MISTDDGTINRLKAPDNIDDAVWNPDASRGWVQYASDGCEALADSGGPLPAIPTYRPAILPAMDGDSLYFLTSSEGQNGCAKGVVQELCRLHSGKLDRLGIFSEPRAIAASTRGVFIVGTHDGKAGIWLHEDGTTSLLAEGDFVAVVSADATSVLGVDNAWRLRKIPMN